MAEWQVNSANPLRDVQGLDHERCAALHNHIIERAWRDSGRDDNELQKRPWWDFFGQEVDTDRLDPSLVEFLKKAWHLDNPNPPHNFHRYLSGLCTYEQMWENAMYADDEDDSNKREYITLYNANWGLQQSRPLGLVYHQRSATAMQHISMHDINITMNGRQQWLRLEVILTGLLEMMDEGKVVPVSQDYAGDQERLDPWIMPSFTERDLEDSLEAFKQLVEVIESKLPSLRLESSPQYGLFEPAWSQITPDGCFARRFLQGARVPRFTYLAPGLRIAQQQPFATMELPEPDMLRPFLLLEGTGIAHVETKTAPWGQDMPVPAFHPEFSGVTNLPVGIYLTESEPKGLHPFEDGCKLLLPYLIGSSCNARTSDDALLGEDLVSKGSTARPGARSTQLFQLGFNHYMEMHDVQLRRVLWRWVEMVRSGEWEVDANGVCGGMDKWREADTQQHWQHYQLPMAW